ncbi:MAG: endopeptidase La [Clostridiales bacterium]|nr:endopeptidase La [Clostridiales bacterium]
MNEELISEPVANTTDMPAMALRGLTIFPGMTVHFDVGREASIRALNVAMEDGDTIFLVTQRDLSVEEPEQKDLYGMGTIVAVRQLLRLPGDNVRIMVEGLSRARLVELRETKPYLIAAVEKIPNVTISGTPRSEAVLRQTYELFEHYAELSPKMAPEVVLTVISSRDPAYLADFIAQNIAIRTEDKQSILDEMRPLRRLEKLNAILKREGEVLELEHDLDDKMQEHMNQVQKDYYLREQLKVIQSELGEGEDSDSDLQEYADKIAQANLPQEVEEKLNKELKRLAKQPFGSAEGSVIRNYLDVCLDLPWNKRTKERVNLEAARKVLDADHYGMEKVKERILEFIAVRKLAPDLRGQIICLAGPPGVGKTSIAASLAKAMNRKMARISLGGIHDEAEIRGHRKTYIGAMPGQIIKAVEKAGSSNPLILLDEVDKLGSDYKGDPSSALLEVLDAEQNATFRDNFLELPFDLSDVLFITTANDLGAVPAPLRDRMEVIELSSYTDEEKLQIARRHLLPKEMKRHGVNGRNFRVTDDAIREIIAGYTMESGVRQLERQLARLCRRGAMQLVSGETKRVTVNGDNLETFLGIRKYHRERYDHTPQVGVVNGLAWTSVGGEMLEVEVNVLPGTGKVEPTGNLGSVMQESCHSAISYIRSAADKLGVPADFYQNKDIHIHFPEGAVPKDGPSAGVTITTAIVSALTNTPVKPDVAMTGEVTLRGRVLPIGGLREKTMAAYRAGMKTVIIPRDNEKDLEEIDPTVAGALRFVTASQVDAVLAEALISLPTGRAEEPKLENPLLPVEHNGPEQGLTIQQ